MSSAAADAILGCGQIKLKKPPRGDRKHRKFSTESKAMQFGGRV